MKTEPTETLAETAAIVKAFESEALLHERAKLIPAPLGASLEEQLAPYADGLVYDRVRVVEEIRFYYTQTVTGIIETGKRLILLKAHEGHGRFIPLCEDELKISRVTAWRFMAMARKLANVSRLKHLVIQDMSKNVGKLYAFLDIPDEELAEFEETGELRGLTIDEIDALPVKEVRDRLRHRNKQVEQGMLALNAADDKIKALESEIETLKAPPVLHTPTEEEYIARVSEIGLDFEGLLLKIEQQIPLDNQKNNPIPPLALKKLLYLYIYMQRELLNARLHLCDFYDGADDGNPYEPSAMELPPDKEITENVAHLAPALAKARERQAEKERRKAEKAARPPDPGPDTPKA